MQTLLVTHSGYVLFLIFCSQAHKVKFTFRRYLQEERFLYITYPLLYLGSALSVAVPLFYCLFIRPSF